MELISSARRNEEASGDVALSTPLKQTFSSQLAAHVDQAIAEAKKKGHDLTEIAMIDIVSDFEAREPDSNLLPRFRTQLGTGYISIPRKVVAPSYPLEAPPSKSTHRQQGSSYEPEPCPPTTLSLSSTTDRQYSAVFKVGIENADLSNEPLLLIEWLKNISPQFGIKLLSVYKSRSWVLLLHAPMKVWYMLDGLPSFELIARVYGSDKQTELCAGAV